jgi:hypothetical protein
MVIAALLLFYGLKLPPQGYNQFVVLVIYVLGLLWSMISLKLNSPEAEGFKVYFTEGFKTFIVVTLVMVVYVFIFYKLNPQILNGVIEENNKLVVAGENHTPAEILENNRKIRDIFVPMTLAINTIKYLLIGAFVSVLGAVSLGRKS